MLATEIDQTQEINKFLKTDSDEPSYSDEFTFDDETFTATVDSFTIEFLDEYSGWIDDLYFIFRGSTVRFFCIEFVDGVRKATDDRVKYVCSALKEALEEARIEYFHNNLDWDKKKIFNRLFRFSFHGLLELQTSSGKWIQPLSETYNNLRKSKTI